MYSLMLAAALTTSGAAPDCCWIGGCGPCGWYGWYGCGVPWAYPPWYGTWGYYPYYYPYYGYPAWAVPAVQVVAVPQPPPPPAPPDAREKALREEVERLRQQLRQLQEAKPRPKETAAPARLVVKLPADARLFVDNDPCPLTSATRSFNTPELRPGVTYQYTIRAEVARQGRTVAQSRRVIVRAGEETVVEFGAMDAVEAASR